MADRSYLYALVPPTFHTSTVPVRISTHPTIVPLAHRLLVAHNARPVPSDLWPGGHAIRGDYAAGRDLLLRFVDLLAAGNLPNREEFDKVVTSLQSRLQHRRTTSFQLEPMEIIAAAYDPDRFDEGIAVQLGAVNATLARAQAALAGDQKEWLERIRSNWRHALDSLYQSHTLTPTPETTVDEVLQLIRGRDHEALEAIDRSWNENALAQFATYYETCANWPERILILQAVVGGIDIDLDPMAIWFLERALNLPTEELDSNSRHMSAEIATLATTHLERLRRRPPEDQLPDELPEVLD